MAVPPSPATTTPHADDGANILTESFTYQATDSLGNIVTSTIVVSIVRSNGRRA